MDRRDPKHLAWVRQQPCCVPDCTMSLIHAHHVRSAANSGTGLKPPDSSVVPLCEAHHRKLHVRGARTFELEHGVDLSVLAVWYTCVSGSDMP